MTDPSRPTGRIVSLDQFRGYTVAGMLLVNFLGSFAVVPAVLKHHNTYCSYADTIMPQFFFAVGFAYRLTFLKRIERAGVGPAYRHALGRNFGLILLGIVLYRLDGGARSWAELQKLGLWGFLTTAFQREVFQTLVHIAVTSLWVLPVIAARPLVRVGFLVFSGLFHLALSYRFYFEWVWNRPGIDGGPLGFLTWTIPLLVGSLAFDAMALLGARRALRRMVGWALVLMALGYGLSCFGTRATVPSGSVSERMVSWLVEPPFVPPRRPVNLWAMSQRAGSLSYQTFGAGFSLAVYALFVALSDLGRLRIGLFRTFGRNALAAYILHDLVAGATKPYAPPDSPLGFALTAFAVYFGVTYLFVRHLENDQIFIRL
jgi:predicted acyltransferase